MLENGKNGNIFKVMFWLMTAICGIWLLGLTNNVIANDRYATAERKQITDCLYSRLGNIEKDIADIKAVLRIKKLDGRTP